MDKPNFFSALRQKLTRQPSAKFQKTFWKSFEGEFASTEIRWKPTRARLLRWIFAPALALLAIFLFKDNPLYRRNVIEDQFADVPYERLIEQTELIENLDLFVGPKEAMAQVDFSELTEEEWKILLTEESG